MVLSPDNDLDEACSVMQDLLDTNVSQIGTNLLDSEDEIIYPVEYFRQSEYQKLLGYLSFWGHLVPDDISPYANDRQRDLIDISTRFNRSNGISDVTAPAGPCIPGKPRLFVNVDEQLFPCERVNENSAMCIGSLDAGYDLKKADAILNIASLTAERCKTCWAQHHCISCAKLADANGTLTAEIRESNCRHSIAKVENDIRLMILSKEVPTFYADFIVSRKESSSDEHK